MLDKNSKEYIAQKQFLQTQSDLFKKHSEERKTINILAIGCSSTSLDDEIRRIPSSHKILQDTLDKAKTLYPDTEVIVRTHILEDMNFDHCEGNYSIDGSYCTRPCWISQKMCIRDSSCDQIIDDLLLLGVQQNYPVEVVVEYEENEIYKKRIEMYEW